MPKKPYERPSIQKLNTGLMNKFGTRTEYQPVTHIDGVPVKRIIEQYGSPVFVLSEKRIRERYREVLRAFTTRYPRVQFAWSYKTNYLNAVSRIYHQEGSWAEVVSGFEYQKALANGVPGDKIIFNGPDKSEEDLRMAVEHDSLIHIDHLDELYMLKRLCENCQKKARVAIRVNMDTGVYPQWDRFGFNYENGQAWDAINKIMASPRLKMVGLHTHIGTFMLAPSAYGVATSKLIDLYQNIQSKFNYRLDYLDLGGGLPSANNLKGAYLTGVDLAPPLADYAEAIASALLTSRIPFDELPLLIMESGRALIDEAGYLLGTVLANKRLSNGKRATILDFGVNLLFTSFWYNHRISPAQEFSQYTEEMELFGPLCMNIDVIRENVNLPLIKKGDHVVAHMVGAYNMTQWMQFITLRPNVVLINEEGKLDLVRQAETVEDINARERVPAHLEEIGM
ncbi:MAG: alanine racemase [Lewinella sp.]|nr:alanine racemase [Lewinella sp.]